MNSFYIFSHAGEAHEAELDGIAHLLSPWYFAIPTFLIVLGLIGYLTWVVSGRKADRVMIVLAILCLLSGFTLFNISAAVSVIAILGGLTISILLTFSGLAAESKNKK